MFCTTAIAVHIDLTFWLSNHVQSILTIRGPWTLTFCLTTVESFVLDTLHKMLCNTNFERNPPNDPKMTLATIRSNVPYKCITDIHDSNFDSCLLYDQPNRFQVTDQFETSALEWPKKDLEHYRFKDFRSMHKLGPIGCKKYWTGRKVHFEMLYAWSTCGPMLRNLKVSQFVWKSKFQKS